MTMFSRHDKPAEKTATTTPAPNGAAPAAEPARGQATAQPIARTAPDLTMIAASPAFMDPASYSPRPPGSACDFRYSNSSGLEG